MSFGSWWSLWVGPLSGLSKRPGRNIRNLDKCMSDDFMLLYRSNGEMETFCQCTAKLTHESNVDFQEAMDSLVILSRSDAQAPLTPDARLTLGILYYCDGVALND